MKLFLKRSLLTVAFVLSSLMCIKSLAASESNVVELTSNNTISFVQDIDNVSADIFVAALAGKRLMLPPTEPIYIVLVSPGGSFESAIFMTNVIKIVPNVAVICKYCASAAGYILVSSPKRYVISSSSIMMHEAYLPRVTAKMAKDPELAKNLSKNSDEFNAVFIKATGLTKAQYEDKILDKEWNVSGQDIVKLNLADKLVKVHCDNYIKGLLPLTCSE